MKHPKVGLLSGFMTRLAIYALKFALIYHVAESKSLQITPQAMYRAILAVEYLKTELFRLADESFGTPWEKDRNRAIKYIKDSMPEGLTFRDWYRHMNMKKRDAEDIRNALLATGDIVMIEGKMKVSDEYDLS